ncbi:hypothetical protein [Clostridium sp. UBA5119]|uniref:hypothetical protein n=1 Tax=Clostridium sp. UBA5119 TaxID=1946366 RepID=UPI0032176B3A
MSIISGIFPSEIVDIDESGLPIYDRAVDEEYFAKYHSEFLSNGVYANPSNNFQVMVNDLMKLKVKAGSCFINGYYAYDNFDGEIILEPASSDLNRIDRIVTRLDRINRKISIEVKKGAYGTASYSAPDLQRDDDIWELGLADVLVKKGTTQIVQANITDLRSIQEYCGYVYNPMQNIDTTDLFAQYDNSFEVWFQHVKDQLSTDAAGNLQKQIDTHTSELEDFMNFLNNGGSLFNTLNFAPLNDVVDTISTTKQHLGINAGTKGIVVDGNNNALRPSSTAMDTMTIGTATYGFKDVILSGGIGSVRDAIIVGSGSNANGRYIKFGDGTMICYTSTPSLTTSESFGVGYKSPMWTWTFPIIFTATPKILALGNNYTVASGGSIGYSTGLVNVISFDSAGRVGGAQVFAIGRWK